jgi:hypothetical protein
VSALERYWLRPIPAVRGWLALSCTLLLFAFDAWSEHLRPAWRYGKAGFNVAHFAILDALLPTPTTAAYVAVIIGAGIAAFVAALSPRPPRALLIALAASYLWSWACSMHDSYQHHYLLSLFFIAFAFFPPLSAHDLFGDPRDLEARPTTAPAPGDDDEPKRSTPKKRKKDKRAAPRREASAQAAAPLAGALDSALPHGLVPVASSPGLIAIWATTAVVYAYTALSKTEPDWIGGDALRNLTRQGESIPEAIAFFAALGIEGDSLWPFLGASTVALQVACALGYATAPLRDRATGRARIVLEIVAIGALALALSFHLGAEYLGLEIGWFSWYMILLAVITFTPARWLSYAVLFATWPARELGGRLARSGGALASPTTSAVLALVAGTLISIAGSYVDLPGGLAACLVAGGVLLGAALFVLFRGAFAAELASAAIVVLLAGPLLLFSLAFVGGDSGVDAEGQPIAHHDVRYDYWRFAGGDFRRRGEWALALDAYTRANAHAPEGESRREREDEMRRRIDAEGPRRAPR